MQELRSSRPDRLLTAGLIGLVLWPPVAMGGVAPWARSLIFVWAAGLLGLWLLRQARAGQVTFARHPVWVVIVAFLGLAALQLLPLPADWLGRTQPATVEAYARAPAAAATLTHPISLSPYDTRMALLRIGALALVFFLVVQVVRTRGQILALAVALLAAGLFESLYGLAETFSGQHHIFALPHPYPGEAVTGTYLNKNHLAGLLEMVVPLGLGLVFALGAARTSATAAGQRAGRWRLRIASVAATPHFALRLTAAAVTVLLVVTLLLTLSRAGTGALVVALAVLLLAGLRFLGLRRGALAALAFVVLVSATAGFVGLSRVTARLEDAASGQAASWEDRLDLSASGLRYAADFPLFGTGLGTFGAVFPAYQSGRFGDRRADYLHNDWLQLVCETGVVGAIVFAAGLALFLATILRNLRRRHSPFARWMTTGAVAGVAAMLVHSAFDYNLSRITANGLVFAVLLGLAYRASALRADGSTDVSTAPQASFPLRRAPARLALAALAPLVLVAAIAVAHAPARADLAYNGYLATAAPAARAADYFFLDAVWPAAFADSTRRAEHLARAAGLDPDDPRLAHALGLAAQERAETLTRARARSAAKLLVGGSGAPGAPGAPGASGAATAALDALTESLARSLRTELRDVRRPFLAAAAAHFRRAVVLGPTRATSWTELAAVCAELAPGDATAGIAMHHALALAPNRPAVLFTAGVHALGRGDRARARPCFRRAIQGDSAYAERVFTVARAAGAGTEDLFALTPATRLGYANLMHALWRDGDWPAVIRCLDALEPLLAGDPPARLELARRRAVALAVQGNARAHAAAVVAYRLRLRAVLSPELDAARSLRRSGRTLEAAEAVLEVLHRDPGWVDARLEAAELATLPRVAAHLPPGHRPLDHLLCLTRNLGEATEIAVSRARRVLALEAPRDDADRDEMAIVAAELDLASGRAAAGLNALRSLAEQHPSTRAQLRLARAAERRGDVEEARRAYAAVVDLAPRHAAALAGLLRLGDARFASRAAALVPPVALQAGFGGRFTLLGYGFERAAGPDGARWELSLYWRIDELGTEPTRAVVHFLDAAWGKVFEIAHALPSAAVLPAAADVADVADDPPRPGEVTIARVALPDDPRRTAFLRFGVIQTARSDAHDTRFLPPTWGERFVAARLDFTGAANPAAPGGDLP